MTMGTFVNVSLVGIIALYCVAVTESSSSCEEGWKSFGGSCYLFAPGATTFYRARDQCRSVNASLVDIRSQEENLFIAGQTLGSGHWVGLRGTAPWTWEASGRPLTCDGFSNWARGNPRSASGHCGAYFPGSGWRSFPCDRERPFVCKAMKVSGSCENGWRDHGQNCYLFEGYRHPALWKTWHAAQQHCESLSADLADMDTAEENEFLRLSISGLSPHLTHVSWIGLRLRLAKWTWNSDSAEIDYSNWGSEENPERVEGDNSCAQVWVGGKWKASRCSERRPYICKAVLDTCEHLSYGPCSHTCGEGRKSRTITCRKEDVYQFTLESAPCRNLPPCAP